MASTIEIIGNERDLFDDECPLHLRDRVHPEDFALVIHIVNRMALRMQRVYFQAPWYRFGFLDGWFNITPTVTDDGAVSNDDIDSIRDAISEFLYEENIKHWTPRGFRWDFINQQPLNFEILPRFDSNATNEALARTSEYSHDHMPYGSYGLCLTSLSVGGVSHNHMHHSNAAASTVGDVQLSIIPD